jgi:DNA mismatch repair protein MutS2
MPAISGGWRASGGRFSPGAASRPRRPSGAPAPRRSGSGRSFGSSKGKPGSQLNEISRRIEEQAAPPEEDEPESRRAGEPETDEPVVSPASETDGQAPSAGDLVWVADLSQRGTLLSVSGSKAQVQIGSMRMALPYESLRRIVTPRTLSTSVPISTGQPRVTSGSDLRMRARAGISPEVKLLGMRAEQALMRLDEYVDEACLAGLSPLRIVHGKGTGALKKVVWEFLQQHPSVATFRHPAEEEGGTGVTVVELKE